MYSIQAIALDVDGVLTDGCFWWGANGQEWKRFCFADGDGHIAGTPLWNYGDVDFRRK